jgi:hypothetical protein
MRGVAVTAAAKRGGDVAAAFEALRRALESTNSERTGSWSDEGAPTYREGDGHGSETYEHKNNEQKPFCETLHPLFVHKTR